MCESMGGRKLRRVKTAGQRGQNATDIRTMKKQLRRGRWCVLQTWTKTCYNVK